MTSERARRDNVLMEFMGDKEEAATILSGGIDMSALWVEMMERIQALEARIETTDEARQ